MSEEWFGTYPSNEAVSILHVWPESGVYNLRARAKDVYNATSGWGTFKIVIPRAKFNIRTAFVQFLERVLEIFKSNHIFIYLNTHIYNMWGGL